MVTVPFFEDNTNSYCQWPPSPLNAEPQVHQVNPDLAMLERIVDLPITPAVIGKPPAFLLLPLTPAYMRIYRTRSLPRRQSRRGRPGPTTLVVIDPIISVIGAK